MNKEVLNFETEADKNLLKIELISKKHRFNDDSIRSINKFLDDNCSIVAIGGN